MLKEVRTWLAAVRAPTKADLRGRSLVIQRYGQVLDNLSIDQHSVLQYQVEDFLGVGQRYLVPEQLKDAVFQVSHEQATAGHFGVTATMARARRKFWYPGMNVETRLRVQVCVVCLQKTMKEKTKAGSHVQATNGFPGQTLYIDLVMMPPCPEGFNYILSMEDGFSRYIQLVPLKQKTAKKVVDVLMRTYVCRFGCPLTIHSDNGREFVNMTTLVANPQSNNVERIYQTLGAHFRMWTKRMSVDGAR